MPYDITKHLAYNVSGQQGGASGSAALTSVVLRPLGGGKAEGSEDLIIEEARRCGSLKVGQMLNADGLGRDYLVAGCMPELAPRAVGLVSVTTQITLDSKPVSVLGKCHILPYEDTKPPNPNLTYDVYLRPHLMERCGPLYDGYEFSHKDCRFRVIATQPGASDASAQLYCCRDTEVFWKGPPIVRPILRSAKALPFFQTLPEGGLDAASREAVVRRHFEQHSAPLQVAEEFTTAEGIRFRIAECDPSRGAIMPSTKLTCEGPPLMGCAVCGSLAVRRCETPGCGKLLCTAHTKQVEQDGRKKTLCPEHGPQDAGCTLQ